MDKSMHVSRAAYVSAFEHILYSARGSDITHVASARVCMTPPACVRGEHQYVSDIEVEKECAAFYLAHSYPAQRGMESPLSASVRVSCSVGVVLAVFPVLGKTPFVQPLKRYSSVCLFNATGNLPQIIGSSSR